MVLRLGLSQGHSEVLLSSQSASNSGLPTLALLVFRWEDAYPHDPQGQRAKELLIVYVKTPCDEGGSKRQQ